MPASQPELSERNSSHFPVLETLGLAPTCHVVREPKKPQEEPPGERTCQTALPAHSLIQQPPPCGLAAAAAAAAAAKSLQSPPTLCDPIDGSPPGSTDPGILQARTLEWVAISFSNV